MPFKIIDILENMDIYYSSKGHIELICDQCGQTFMRNKRNIINRIKANAKTAFCSHKCQSERYNKQELVKCANCGNQFTKKQNLIRKSKSGNSFCNHSCAATYNNTHKKHGTRRSKLEKWLEEELTKIYPNLEIHFNRKDAINSELDIYIPPLKLAFELNGIFHYEPIYGQEKLASIQNNDKRKFQACLEKSIELCMIDVSQLKYFKTNKAQKYLDIIVEIVNSKL